MARRAGVIVLSPLAASCTHLAVCAGPVCLHEALTHPVTFVSSTPGRAQASGVQLGLILLLTFPGCCLVLCALFLWVVSPGLTCLHEALAHLVALVAARPASSPVHGQACGVQVVLILLLQQLPVGLVLQPAVRLRLQGWGQLHACSR